MEFQGFSEFVQNPGGVRYRRGHRIQFLQCRDWHACLSLHHAHFTVVNMKDRNLIFTDQIIKLVDHTVEITTDIITTVVSVAGIKTDTQLVAVDYAVIDCCKFFKRPAKFRSFSRHGFQCNMKRRVFCQDFIEPLYDLLKSGFNSGTDVGTRMQNQSLVFCRRPRGQFLLPEIPRPVHMSQVLWYYQD